MQYLIKFHRFGHKILSGNEILTVTQGHNCVAWLRKLTCNNPKLDLVNNIAYAKFGLIPSIPSQDIVWKRNSDDNQGP